MIRLGLIGAGAIAAEHVASFGRLGCEVLAVMAPDAASASAFAQRHGIPRSTDDLSDVLGAGDIDAVVVASPHAAHAKQALAALEAGKHVLCEIPVALSLREVERISQASSAAGVLCMACHTQRFWGPVQRLRSLVANGTITPLHLGLIRGMLRRTNVGWTGKPRSWADDVLWHHGAHAIDTATCLLGEDIVDITGHSGPESAASERPLDVSLSVTTTSRRIGTILLSYNSHSALNDIVLVAEQDTYRFGSGELRDSRGEVLLHGVEPRLQERAMDAQNGQFVEGITCGASVDTEIQRALPIYVLLHKAAAFMTHKDGV